MTTCLKRRPWYPGKTVIHIGGVVVGAMPTFIQGTDYDEVIGRKITIKRIKITFSFLLPGARKSYTSSAVKPQHITARLLYKRTADVFPAHTWYSFMDNSTWQAEIDYSNQDDLFELARIDETFEGIEKGHVPTTNQWLYQFPIRPMIERVVDIEVNLPIVFGIKTISPSNGLLPLTGELYLAYNTSLQTAYKPEDAEVEVDTYYEFWYEDQ